MIWQERKKPIDNNGYNPQRRQLAVWSRRELIKPIVILGVKKRDKYYLTCICASDLICMSPDPT